MTGMLASVCSADEARLALQSWADVIDCKNPREGALGALPPETISRIAAEVDGERPISATTGDLVCGVQRLREAVTITADCGVDYVKFGLFDRQTAAAQIDGLQRQAARQELIAVCFADRVDPTPLLPRLAGAGIRGVMLDTADKYAGRLTELWGGPRLADFVAAAHTQGLLCGLAGRLTQADIPLLLPLQSDYLGFRSALCRGDRQGHLDAVAMMRVRAAIPWHAGSATRGRTAMLLP